MSRSDDYSTSWPLGPQSNSSSATWPPPWIGDFQKYLNSDREVLRRKFNRLVKELGIQTRVGLGPFQIDLVLEFERIIGLASDAQIHKALEILRE